MIVKVDSDLFLSTDSEILKGITVIIREALDDRFLFDSSETYESMDTIKTSFWFQSYLSEAEKDEFTELLNLLELKSSYISELHRLFLTTIVVGLKDGQVHPRDAKSLIIERSKVILENAVNDWKFIKGIIKKYQNDKNKKTIYRLLLKAVENNRLEPEQAGGKGEIIKRIEDILDRYGPIYRMKLGVVFDSDKEFESQDLSKTHIKTISFLKQGKSIKGNEIFEDGDLIVWHILYKREMENYLPLDIIKEYYPEQEANCKTLNGLQPNELDFCDMKKVFSEIEAEMPNLFLEEAWRKNLLEDRCSHHFHQIPTPNGILEAVSEIEYLLLKIAKII